MNERLELYKQFGQKQENFTYYIIALSIAAIGYSVHQTNGKGFELNQIILALAVLSWGASVYLGFQFLKLAMSLIFSNVGLIDLLEGNHNLAGNDQSRIAEGHNVLMNIIKKDSEKAGTYSKWQNNLFYLGILIYLFWHIFNMCSNTYYVDQCI